jgi:hypothetical protein
MICQDNNRSTVHHHYKRSTTKERSNLEVEFHCYNATFASTIRLWHWHQKKELAQRSQSKSDDNDDEVVVAAAVAVAADPPLANTIKYKAMPKLLFVDMQQEDEEKVAAAVTKLTDLLNASNANRKGPWQKIEDAELVVVVVVLVSCGNRLRGL